MSRRQRTTRSQEECVTRLDLGRGSHKDYVPSIPSGQGPTMSFERFMKQYELKKHAHRRIRKPARPSLFFLLTRTQRMRHAMTGSLAEPTFKATGAQHQRITVTGHQAANLMLFKKHRAAHNSKMPVLHYAPSPTKR